MEDPSLLAIVWTIVFTLSKMGSDFMILDRRVPWCDLSFKRLTLACLLTIDFKGTRILGNLVRDSSDLVEGVRNR